VNDIPIGPSEFYTIFKMDNRDAAAAYTMRPEERSQGAPSHWNLYIAVDNADQMVERAAHLGGPSFGPAFEVPGAGRMGVIQDPTGAVFSVWQPKGNKGLGITGEPGTFCWADLSTPRPERAKQFYSELFGWQLTPGEHDTSGYLHIKNGDEFIGGVPPANQRDPSAPAHWMIYFSVSDVDRTAEEAKTLGAKLLMPPTTIENVGRMAVLADPQGAVSAIFKSARE
jgi:predicted enzyme related to lactoylglutathione lyase